MKFKNKVSKLSASIHENSNETLSIEGGKTALVLPFLNLLGYDIFGPKEVIHDFCGADDSKKSNRADYGVSLDGDVQMVFDYFTKGDKKLERERVKMKGKFQNYGTKFVILTDGFEYSFFSDIDSKGSMDGGAFFVFNILDYSDEDIDFLSGFRKETFSEPKMVEEARVMKYETGIKDILERELTSPSDEFIRFFGTQVFEGNLTRGVLDEFKVFVKRARIKFFEEKILELVTGMLGSQETETVEVSEQAEPQKKTSDLPETKETVDRLFNELKDLVGAEGIECEVDIRTTQSYSIARANGVDFCRIRVGKKNTVLGFLLSTGESKAIVDGKISEIDGIAELINAAVEKAGVRINAAQDDKTSIETNDADSPNGDEAGIGTDESIVYANNDAETDDEATTLAEAENAIETTTDDNPVDDAETDGETTANTEAETNVDVEEVSSVKTDDETPANTEAEPESIVPAVGEPGVDAGAESSASEKEDEKEAFPEF